MAKPQYTKKEEVSNIDTDTNNPLLVTAVEEDIKTSSTPSNETTKTMTEVNNNIIIKFEKHATIKFVIQNTGEESPRILHDQKVPLSRGTIYKLPITDANLDLQKSYVIRPSAKFADSVRILNVHDGFVTIEPLIHGVILNDQDNIGCLI